MAWKERSRVDERVLLVGEYSKGERAMTELCQEFGVSADNGACDRLLRVTDVAERLGSVPRPSIGCVNGASCPHVRMVNSIRVRRADLDALVAGLATGAPKAGRRRSSAE